MGGILSEMTKKYVFFSYAYITELLSSLYYFENGYTNLSGYEYFLLFSYKFFDEYILTNFLNHFH